MGVFYNSFCLRGDRSEEVRSSLRRWLHARGFELSGQPMLFDLDGEAERSAFLVSDGRWTILVFSKYEEEGRLLRELATWSSPLVYVWVQDSEAWGYDVVVESGFAGSFTSDSKVFNSFEEDSADRPAAEPEELERLLGGTGSAAELRKIQRRRKVFAEDVCFDFCRWMRAEAAAVSYDDLERGTVAELEGWKIEQLLFYHPDSVAPPAVGTDLHAIDLQDLGVFSVLHPQSELTPELKAEVEEMRRRARLRWALLRPVSWLARGWGWARARLAPRLEAAGLSDPEADDRASDSAHGGARRINERHHCQVTLARGMRSKPVSGKPAAVFAFEAGSTPITCTARRLWKIDDVLRPPSRSEVLRDEKYSTESGLRARHLLLKLPPRYMAETDDPSFLGLHVIETRVALYVFLYRFTREVKPEVDDAVRLTAASFRQREGAQALWSPVPAKVP